MGLHKNLDHQLEYLSNCSAVEISLTDGNQRLQMHTPSPRRSSSMDECVDDMTPPSPTNDADFVKHLAGDVCLKSGKWVAKIWHPVRKVWVCVGIYNNHEEAADAYARKKLEYESHSVQKTAASFNTNVADFEKRPGVRRTASGKWSAYIKHKKVTVWLGSYNTLNEAADAYDMSKLELQSPKAHSLTKAGGSVVSRGSVYQEKSAKWRAQIHIRKVRHRLGSYANAEDAREALDRMKCELGSKAEDAQEDLNQKKCEIGLKGEDAQEALNRKKCELGLKGEDAQEALNQKKCEIGLKGEDAEEALNRKKCELGLNGDAEQSERNQSRRHAYVRKSGRWQMDITHPMKKRKNIYLGSFDTAEEAEDAYNSVRRQFELMFPGYLKCRQSKERVHLGALTEEAEESYNNKMREIDLIVRAYKKPHQLKGRCEADLNAEGKSDSICVSDDSFVCTNGSSVIKAITEEDDGFVMKEMGEFDSGVIDSCGRLVGVYSKMDDELWIG